MKPDIFIGSSFRSEDKPVVDAIKGILDELRILVDGRAGVWNTTTVAER